jgi:hypothetical protein
MKNKFYSIILWGGVILFGFQSDQIIAQQHYKQGAITYKYNTNTGVVGGGISITNPSNASYGGPLTSAGPGYYAGNVQMLPQNTYYDISPIMPSLGYIDGVNTIDLLRIQRHLLNITPLTNWFDQIAADVDGSYTITNNDLSLVQQLVLGVTNTLPVTEWSWVSKWWIQSVGQQWFLINFPVGAQFTPSSLLENPHLVFRATKSGDIDGSNSSIALTYFPYFKSTELESRGSSIATSGEKGDIFRLSIEVSAEEPLMGYELPLKIDHTKYEVVEVNSPSRFLNTKHHDGIVILDYSNGSEPLLEENENIQINILLKLKKNEFVSSEDIDVMDKRDLLLIDKNAEQTSKGKISIELVKVNLNQDLLAKIYDNGTDVLLEVNAAFGIKTTLNIYTSLGQLVSSQPIFLEKGDNKITLNKNQFGKGLNLINMTFKEQPSRTLKFLSY